MEIYQPDVIVLQSGADSLAPIHDYACNLSIKGHGRCLHYIKSFDVPLMVLGGRGSLEDVRNCWPYETAIALGIEEHQFPEKVMTAFSRCNAVADLNTTRDIESIKNRLQLQLSQVMHPRSISGKNTEAVDYESESDEEWHFLG